MLLASIGWAQKTVRVENSTGALVDPANFFHANAVGLAAALEGVRALIPFEEPTTAQTTNSSPFLIWSPNGGPSVDEGFAGWVDVATFRDRLELTSAAVGHADGLTDGTLPPGRLPATGIAAGTYRSLTIDNSGRATAGTNPTTLSGYGITDAVPATRTLTTTAPLKINGVTSADLSTNRPLTIDAATTAASGAVRLATPAETIAGALETVANTPAGGLAALRGYVDPIAATRQGLLGWGWSDALTTGRRIVWEMGTAGNLTGSPLTMAGFIYTVPAVDPPINAALWQTSNTSAAIGADTGNNVTGLWHSVDGSLQLRIGTDGSHRAAWSIPGWRVANAGKTVRFDVVSGSDTAVLPTVYQDGAPLTGWILSVAVGTAPNWQSATSGGAWLIQGAGMAAAAFQPATPINRTLTQAEIQQMIRLGGVLPQDRPGGNVAIENTVTFVNNAGAAGFETFSSASATGFSAIATDGYSQAVVPLPVYRGGGRARMTYDLVVNSGAVPGAVFNGQSSGLQSLSAGTNQSVVITADSSRAAGLAILTTAPSDFTISNIRIVREGAILQPEITRTAQVLDHGPNRIRGVMTAGIRPLCDRDPVPLRGNQTATGFALGLGSADPIWFEPALITAIRIKQSTAAAQTITLRLNSSGGTVIASATTAANTDWQAIALSIPGGFEINSGDRLHWTITNALDWDLNWTRR